MAKIPKCNCVGCNNVGTHKMSVYRRGERNAYLCNYHFNSLESYFAQNNNEQGTTKQNGFKFGVEFETSKSTTKARIELTASGYLPTMDSTVDAEYKSPIMKGLNSLSKHCVTFERLINENQLEVDSSCGTHLHISNDAMSDEMWRYINVFYHSLFIPLSNAMESNPQATERLFGRTLNRWATPINNNTIVDAHTNFINMQHRGRIEFRCCKYINAKQYMNCAKFCRDVVATVLTNFCEHFDEEPKDKRRYANKIEYRRHKAQVTAKKLVKLFEKYSN